MAGVPLAVVVTGAPGTGKSTLARHLAARLRAALLDQDVATGPLVAVIQQLVGINDLDDEHLAGLTRSARYAAIADLAVDNLTAGVPVVLVAPFTRELADPVAWARLSERLTGAGGRPFLVWLTLEPEQRRRRLQARAAPRDEVKRAGPDARPVRPVLPVGSEPAAGRPAVAHLVLAADQPPERLVQAVLSVVHSSGF